MVTVSVKRNSAGIQATYYISILFVLIAFQRLKGAVSQEHSNVSTALSSSSFNSSESALMSLSGSSKDNLVNTTLGPDMNATHDKIHLSLKSFTTRGYHTNYTAPKEKELTVLISITSGPAHTHLRNAARETWLLPCKASPVCDYRFFIDKPLANITIELVQENTSHADLVFRDPSWCPWMARHPYEKLNYGNVFQHPWVYGGGGVPYYQYRGVYKVDWKVCFTRWAREFNKMALYHVYVEDDSFVCTENLLHQMTLLKNTPLEARGNPFRTGTPMWDGFDDSSTIMSREIVEAFARYYPEEGFNCSSLVDQGNPALLTWMSWGNSWKGGSCNWRGALMDKANISVNTPLVSKQFLPCIAFPHRGRKHVNDTYAPTIAPTPAPTFNYTKFEFPCREAMILHHGVAGDIVLDHHKGEIPPEPDNPVTKHACEYMLLLDKIKDPVQMGKLWNQTTGTNYIDMSVVFTMNGGDGWIQLLDTLHRIEKTCIRGDPSPSADCLKWKREKRRRNLKITEQIYDTAADRPVEGEEREEGTSKGHDSIYGKGLRPRSTGVTTEKDNVDGAFVHHTHERSLNDEQSHRRRKEKKYEDNNDKYNENADDNENDDDNDNPGYRVYFGDIIHTLYGRNRNRNRHLI